MHFTVVTVAETGSHSILPVNLELSVRTRLASNSQRSYIICLPRARIKAWGHCAWFVKKRNLLDNRSKMRYTFMFKNNDS